MTIDEFKSLRPGDVVKYSDAFFNPYRYVVYADGDCVALINPGRLHFQRVLSVSYYHDDLERAALYSPPLSVTAPLVPAVKPYDDSQGLWAFEIDDATDVVRYLREILRAQKAAKFCMEL